MISDIDECSEGSDTCDENANCTNTDGSFECQCKIGFSGHGHTCTGYFCHVFKSLNLFLLSINANLFFLNISFVNI